MNTNIAHKADGKWSVVTTQTITGTVSDASTEARAVCMTKAVMFSKRFNSNGWGSVVCISTLTMSGRAHAWIQWVIDSYGFCLTTRKDYTPAEFAQAISAVYDATEPHSAKAIEILSDLDKFNV